MPRPGKRGFLSPVSFVIALIAILITYGTGQLLTTIFASPAGEIDSWYGFPLPWREQRDIVCGAFNPPPCRSDILVTNYDWISFGVDVLFFVVAAYAMVLIVRRIHPSRASSAEKPAKIDIPPPG